MPKSSLPSWLCALVLLMPLPSFALSCGDTVTSDVRLTADLHCTAGYYALHVPTSGVTIDLNGHTLSGDTGIPGISIYNASSVTIKGPGKIRGFSIGVYGQRSHALKVMGVDFEDNVAGASISHALSNTFAGNTFSRSSAIALAFYDNSTIDPRIGPGYHSIVDNAFSDVDGGVQLCGMDTGSSTIANNAFARSKAFAIRLLDSSDRNTIHSNAIWNAADYGIVVRSSNMNRIHDNGIDTGSIGVFVDAGLGSCNRPASAGDLAYSNDIESNLIRQQIIAIQFGNGGAGRPVRKNFARLNQLHDNVLGIYYRIDTVSNTAIANDVAGTFTPVIDESGINYYY